MDQVNNTPQETQVQQDVTSQPQTNEVSLASIPDAGTEQVKQAEQRKWAGKYDSPEALEAGYAEAQKLISQRTVSSMDDLTSRLGVKMDDVVANYITDGGKFSEQHKQSFANAGIGEDLARRLVEGEVSRIQVAQYEVERVKNEVAAVAGGKAQQDNILNWAANNMLKSEIESFNTRLNDPNQSVSAMREIAFMHQKAVGSGNARPLVQGMTPPAEVEGFDSVNAVINAMRSVRKQGYVDETTRRKLANTPKNFIQGMNQ